MNGSPAALAPEQGKGGDFEMGLAYSLDLIQWTDALDAPVLPRRPGRWDSRVVEPGPAPILTPDGIILIYDGADDSLVYRTGVVRFDRRDPRRVLSRTDSPIFAPDAEWEKVGQVANVSRLRPRSDRGQSGFSSLPW